MGCFRQCLGVDALTKGLPLCTHFISDIRRHLGTNTVLGMYMIGRFQLSIKLRANGVFGAQSLQRRLMRSWSAARVL